MVPLPFHKPRKLPPDFFSEHTELVNGDRRREWQWDLPGDHMGLKLPLYIQHCGNSVWGKGVRITRKNSFIFGLELVVSGSMEFQQDQR